MRSSSTRRACGSRQPCGKRQERVSHKVFGRAQNARPHAPQAVRFSLTENKAKTPEGSPCVRGDVVRYSQPSPEWPVFKRSSVAAFQRSVTHRKAPLEAGLVGWRAAHSKQRATAASSAAGEAYIDQDQRQGVTAMGDATAGERKAPPPGEGGALAAIRRRPYRDIQRDRRSSDVDPTG